MSEENVERVCRAFEAFNRGDRDEAVVDIAADLEYISSGAVPGTADTNRGPEGFKRFSGWLLDQFDDVRVEINEIVGEGDQVVTSLTTRGRGKRSGIETTWDTWQLWTFRDGKAVHGQGFISKDEALEAAGLRE